MKPSAHRFAVLATATGTALLLAAGPASAVVSVNAVTPNVSVTGNDDPDSATATCNAGVLTINGAGTGQQCGAVTGLTINLANGADVVTLTAVTDALFGALPATSVTTIDPTTPAADTVFGSPKRDAVTSDALDTVSTDDGADQIEGGRIIDGGSGNDRFINPALVSGGSIQGGAGTDAVEVDYQGREDTAASFSFAASGVTTGGVTVPVANVEQFVLSLPDGTAASQVSTVDSRATAVRLVVRMHGGIDQFLGGPANDYVDAGPGTDTVDAGAGVDSVQGGEGADTVLVRDGEVDVVDCGDGADSVIADRGDVVKNCEAVDLPPLPAPPPAAAPETSSVIGLKKVARGVKASFLFVSSAAGAGFECRLDNRAWRACTSPYKVNTRNLKIGKHKVYVRATLSGGNIDASSSKFGFRVLKPKRR